LNYGNDNGRRGGYSSDINVTPMIDVLLVLLIIFMVIVPVTPKGLDALVPQPPRTRSSRPSRMTAPLWCRFWFIRGPPSYKINESDVYNGVGGPRAQKELLQRLTEIYANRAERIMFVKGDDNLDFRYVAEVIDIGRAAKRGSHRFDDARIMAGQ